MATVHVFEPYFTSYIHIPRTAGTSISKWMQKAANGNEYTLLDHHPNAHFANVVLIPNNWVFTSVRNPWDRMVSLYEFVSALPSDEYPDYFSNLDKLTNGKPPTSFRAWLTLVPDLKVNNNYWWNISTPQADWISTMKPDLIIKFENLMHEFEQIQTRFNCWEPLTFEKFSKNMGYKDYYNTESKKLVGKIYEKDVDLWKYSF